MIVDSVLGLSEMDWHVEYPHVYLGSPSIVRTLTTALLGSHDYFGSTTAIYNVTIFTSSDDGLNWTFVANVSGMYWATLFPCGNRTVAAVCLLGTAGDNEGENKGHSSVVISITTDNGEA